MIVDLDTKVIQGTPYWEDIYKFIENATSIPIPEEHEEDNVEPNVTFNSASFKCSYLMSNSLNDKWLAWTIETPQKSPFMIKRWQERCLMGQASPLIQLSEAQLESRKEGRIKGEDSQQGMGSRKN